MQRRNSKTALAVILGFSAATLFLQACGAKTVIKFAGRADKGSESYAIFAKAIKDYEAQHPNVKVEYLPETGAQEYKDKLLVMYASNSAPDVVRLYGSWVMEFADRGLLSPYPADVLSRVKPLYYPSVLECLSYKGKVYGLGDENQIHGLTYSKKILAQSGIADVPDNWEDLMALSSKLTMPNPNGRTMKQTGFSTELAEWCFTGLFRTLLSARGGSYASGKKLLFDSKEGASVLKDMNEWFTQRKMASASVWDNPDGGKIAFTLAYPFYTMWYPKYKTKVDDILGVALMPAGPSGRYGHHYTWGVCVSSTSRNKSAATDFAEFISTYPGANDGMTFTGASVSGISVASVKRNSGRGAYAQKGLINWFNGFEKNLDTIKPVQALEPYSSKAEEILFNNLMPAVNGKIPPDAALANAKRILQTVANRYYK